MLSMIEIWHICRWSILLLLLVSKVTSQPSRLVGFFDYPPKLYCDINDPTNISKIGGVAFNNFMPILNKTTFQNDIQPICIDYFAFLQSYFGDGSILPNLIVSYTLPINSLSLRYSQSITLVPFYIMVNYEEKPWIFFWLYDPLIFIFFIGAIILASILLSVYNSKIPVYYQVSDYVGLLFYQPELCGSKPLAAKVLTLSYYIASLIILTYFIGALNYSEDDLKSTGGIDFAGGLYREKVVMEVIHVPQFIGSLMIPLQVPVTAEMSDWISIFEKHKNTPIFIAISSAMQAINCNYRVLGKISDLHFGSVLKNMNQSETINLNAAIIDHVTNRKEFIQEFKVEEFLTNEQIICKKYRSFSNFRFQFFDFKELWYIYAIGALIASINAFVKHIHFCISNFKSTQLFDGYRNKCIMACTQNIRRIAKIYTHFLYSYQVKMLFPSLIQKYKKVRKLVIKHKIWTANKLAQTRSRVVKCYLTSKKRKSLWSFKRTFYLKLFSKKTAKIIGVKQKITSIVQKFRHKKNQRKYIKLHNFIDEVLICIFVKALRINNFVNCDYSPNVEFLKIKPLFHSSVQFVQLKRVSRMPYLVECNLYHTLLIMFEEKLTNFLLLQFSKNNLHKELRCRSKKNTKKLQFLLSKNEISRKTRAITRMIVFLHRRKYQRLQQKPNENSIPPIANIPINFLTNNGIQSGE